MLLILLQRNLYRGGSVAGGPIALAATPTTERPLAFYASAIVKPTKITKRIVPTRRRRRLARWNLKGNGTGLSTT